jgi:hypothetical protein
MIWNLAVDVVARSIATGDWSPWTIVPVPAPRRTLVRCIQFGPLDQNRTAMLLGWLARGVALGVVDGGASCRA